MATVRLDRVFTSCLALSHNVQLLPAAGTGPLHSVPLRLPDSQHQNAGQRASVQAGHAMEALCVQPGEMEALCVQPGEIHGLNTKQTEPAESLTEQLRDSSTDEEEEEDEEPWPPLAVRRKVSFADAFGLNLVSVKEFDNVETADSEPSAPFDIEETISTEDFYMCCLFTVPPTPAELEAKVREQRVELESIELLPKTTTIRGHVRVLNLCYSKQVYVRMTLDGWRSHFDLLAEYVPGSSDRKTDRFTFQYALIPPFDKLGTRVEFCLRYETSAGVFWANCNHMNYVLFVHQKLRENGQQVQDENGYKGKKGCLRFNRSEGAEELIQEMLEAGMYAKDAKCTRKTEASDQATRAGTKSTLHLEETKNTVESIKSLHRAARSARAPDHCPQRRPNVSPGYSHDPPQGQKGSQPIPSACCNSSGPALQLSNKAQTNSAQVLTYHQIPLATLDWGGDKPARCGNDGADKTRTEIAKITLSKSQEDSANDAVSNIWETLANGTEESSTKGSSGSDFATQSGPPESRHPRTPTPISPSNNETPLAQWGASRQTHVGPDSPNLEAPRSSARHPPPDTSATSSAHVALNGEDLTQAAAAQAYVTGPGDDKTGAQNAPRRSETNSGTESAQESRLSGAPPVSKGSVDSPGERRERGIWERAGAGIMGGIGGDEPFTMHGADLVTSSGESETTDMTAMPESPNASAVDIISQGPGLQRGPPRSRDGKVTATAYNTPDDTLAFKETMRQGTADGERFVFSARRQGAEEGLTTNRAGNKDSKKEEIVRPREIEKCQVSREGEGGGGGGGEQQPDFGGECDSLGQHEQNETVASHSDGLCSMRKCEYYLQGPCAEKERDFVSSDENGVVDKRAEISDHKPEIGTECANMQVSEVEAPHKHRDSHGSLSTTPHENTAIFLETKNDRTKSWPPGKERNDKDEIGEPDLETGIETDVTGDGVLQMGKDCREITQGRLAPCEETRPSVATKEEPFATRARTLEISQSDTSPSLAADDYNPGVAEISGTHLSGVITARGCEDVGGRLGSEELAPDEKDTRSASLRPETLDGIEEDISRGDGDERLRIGKPKIEARGERRAGTAENPRGESQNAPAKLKERELSAEVERATLVEYQKISERSKNPIRDDGAVALERPGEEMFPERSGDELVRTVGREGFDCRFDAEAQSDGDEGGAGGGGGGSRSDRSIITIDDKCAETLPTDCEKVEETIGVSTITNTSTDSDEGPSSSPNPQSVALSTGSEESSETKRRSVTLDEIDVKLEDREVAHREGRNETHQRRPGASDDVKNDISTWRSVAHALFHLTRLLICVLLVLGFFLVFFYYDFATFFVLYSFSMCCWICRWRSCQFIPKEQDKKEM
ncbi:uncharacterized protein [Eucyclogobius newberryi]|uniref:uncharacterized protein n=1 Tax=Eucyclogobius newberryi TaxID=166745 RepID=UPI003B59EF4D